MKKTSIGNATASNGDNKDILPGSPVEINDGYSHGFVEALVNSFPEAVALTDNHFKIIFANSKLTDLMSGSDLLLTGKPIFETVFKFPDGDVAKLLREIEMKKAGISLMTDIEGNHNKTEVFVSSFPEPYAYFFLFIIRPQSKAFHDVFESDVSGPSAENLQHVSMAIGQRKVGGEVLKTVIDALTHPFYLVEIESGNVLISNSSATKFEKSLLNVADEINNKRGNCAEKVLAHVCKSVRKAGKSVRVEREFIRPDGEKIIHEVFGYPLPDINGKPWLVIQYFIDITDRKRDELALTEYAGLTENLLKNIPGMAFRCLNDRNWTMEYVSPGCKRLLGYRVDELTGKGQIAFNSLILPGDRERVWQEIQDALERHNFYRTDYHITTRNGKVKWVQESGRALYDREGKLLSIEGLITDVTRLKTSEEKLKHELFVNQAIASTGLELLRGNTGLPRIAGMIQSYLKQFTHSRISYLISRDRTGKFKIYCHSDDDTVSDGLLIPAERLKESIFGQFIGAGKPEIKNDLNYNGALPCITRQKVGLHRLLSVPAVIDKHSDALIILANSEMPYSHDSIAVVQRFINLFALAAYRVQAEDTLREAKLKAEESDRLKSLFLSNMSHDLRTPMNAIVGFAEMLQDTELGRDEKDRFLDAIIKSGDSLLHLVNDIIDISKIEAGQMQLIFSDCNLNDLLNEIEMTFRQELDRQGKSQIMLYTQKGIPVEDFTIHTDAVRIKQILSNLIGNAIKFTDEGFIETGYRIDSGKLLFFVRDSGIGIPAEHQKLIFERFGQVKETSARNLTGTGLGLTISKNLVELLGGKIWLDSIPGEGSTFWFTLPLKKTQPRKEMPALKSSAFSRPDLSDKCILVVEDVDTNYFYICSLLEKLNARVIRAANGRRAVEICQSDPTVNLVLMDIELPVLNGYEATREIKKHRPKLPVIAQTAFAMAGERERSEEAGCDEYLAKPIRKDDLIETISRFIT